MKPRSYRLFLDESGVPSANDPKQRWFVLAGVNVPAEQVGRIERFLTRSIEEFLGVRGLKVPVELKGTKLLSQRREKTPLGLSFADRINLVRELLAVHWFFPGISYFVSAVDTESFHIQGTLDWQWAQELRELTAANPYLFALAELIGDYAFHLDRHMSSGIAELIVMQRSERHIDFGKIYLDRTCRLDSDIRALSEALVRKRDNSEQWGQSPESIQWKLLDDNVEERIRLVDSRDSVLIQLADLLAALIRIKQNGRCLTEELEQLYWEVRLVFQSSSRFWPKEILPKPILRVYSAEQLRLMKRAEQFREDFETTHSASG